MYICFNTASVLIQLHSNLLSRRVTMFQYSFCSYSTGLARVKTEEKEVFQYSFCSYSTERGRVFSRRVRLFQYSFCSYSTKQRRLMRYLQTCFNTASVLIQRVFRIITCKGCVVSIQLLFLFNGRIPIPIVWDRRVSIQLLFLFNMIRDSVSLMSFVFQYSFCSYSTRYKTDNPSKNASFNTASVLIQRACCTGQSVADCVSIQLLFLFNL